MMQQAIIDETAPSTLGVTMPPGYDRQRHILGKTHVPWKVFDNAQYQTRKTAYHDLLPYCTAETPLNEQQVLGLSDVAGSLREVMLVALRAKTDEEYARALAAAVGVDAVQGVVDFFEDEFEI